MPLFYDCRATALRKLQECVNEKNNEQNDISKYPADFTFFEVGEYDRTSGVITMLETKVNLGVCIEYSQKNKE
nr:MAG: nonstructural protein [Microvirus sp.]